MLLPSPRKPPRNVGKPNDRQTVPGRTARLQRSTGRHIEFNQKGGGDLLVPLRQMEWRIIMAIYVYPAIFTKEDDEKYND